jgi:hypothetical protein
MNRHESTVRDLVLGVRDIVGAAENGESYTTAELLGDAFRAMREAPGQFDDAGAWTGPKNTLEDMNYAATNRHNDAIGIQGGACNLSGVARALVRAINQCRNENKGTQEVRDDAAIRLIVHQMAFLCNVAEIDNTSDVYGTLTKECEEKDAAWQDVQAQNLINFALEEKARAARGG